MMDFSKLTKAQIDCMNYHAFQGHAGGKYGADRTLAILVEKGFLVPHERRDRQGAMVFVFTDYEMPLAVHMEWCAHVAHVAKDCDGDV